MKTQRKPINYWARWSQLARAQGRHFASLFFLEPAYHGITIAKRP
jgi:hypothetical protein